MPANIKNNGDASVNETFKSHVLIGPILGEQTTLGNLILTTNY